MKKKKLTQEERMERVRDELVRRAKAKKLIEYGEFIKGDYGVARGDGQPWKIGYVLTEINRKEKDIDEERPVLSSVCVLKRTGMPESAYWRMFFTPKHIQKGTQAQKIAFWKDELKKVFSFPY